MAEGSAPRTVRKGGRELAWSRPAHLKVLGDRGEGVGSSRVASGTPQGGAGIWYVLAQPLQEGVKENKGTGCSCESAG